MYLNIYEISFSKTEVSDIWISKLLVLFSLVQFEVFAVYKFTSPKGLFSEETLYFLSLNLSWSDLSSLCWSPEPPLYLVLIRIISAGWNCDIGFDNAIVLWPLYKWKNASYSLYMTPSDGFWDLVSCVPKKDTQTLQKVLNWNLLAASSRVLALAEWMTSEPV